jgi:hypothetical protein
MRHEHNENGQWAVEQTEQGHWCELSWEDSRLTASQKQGIIVADLFLRALTLCQLCAKPTKITMTSLTQSFRACLDWTPNVLSSRYWMLSRNFS